MREIVGYKDNKPIYKDSGKGRTHNHRGLSHRTEGIAKAVTANLLETLSTMPSRRSKGYIAAIKRRQKGKKLSE